MKRALPVIAFVTFVTFVVPPAGVRADIIEQVLVRVNGEVFTKTDLETRQVDALREMGQDIDPKANLGDAQLRAMLDKVTPQVIAGVVDEMLLLQRGKELGYKLSDEQFTSVLDSIKKDRHLDTDAQFQQALKDSNMSLADLRRQIEKSVVMDRVRQNEVLSKIAVSEEEARRYYDAHKSEFTKPQEVTLREILVAVPTTGGAINVGADNDAKDKAAGLRARALAGDSYEKLAADFSDSPSKANGGLIGPLSSSDISADLRKLFDQMKVGDITEPLRIPTGYQLLKLESRSESQTAPFDQAKDQISDRVFTDKRKDEYEKYMEKLRAQAIIDWKNPDIKKAYDAGIEQIKAGASPLK
jgi:peptidyl-prolyl cis-trans isomerase SurA